MAMLSRAFFSFFYYYHVARPRAWGNLFLEVASFLAAGAECIVLSGGGPGVALDTTPSLAGWPPQLIWPSCVSYVTALEVLCTPPRNWKNARWRCPPPPSCRRSFRRPKLDKVVKVRGAIDEGPRRTRPKTARDV